MFPLERDRSGSRDFILLEQDDAPGSPVRRSFSDVDHKASSFVMVCDSPKTGRRELRASRELTKADIAALAAGLGLEDQAGGSSSMDSLDAFSAPVASAEGRDEVPMPAAALGPLDVDWLAQGAPPNVPNVPLPAQRDEATEEEEDEEAAHARFLCKCEGADVPAEGRSPTGVMDSLRMWSLAE